MKTLWKAVVLFTVTVAILSAVGQAQFLRLDPSLKWQVLETEHFSIIFPPGMEGLAQEAARLAEEAWQYWKKELKYIPPGKTAIVIVPGADFDLGGASTMPQNEIMIGTSEARTFSEWLNSRGPSGLEQVIYHEYGHIVDIGKVSGFSRFLRDLFGSIVMPNGFKPGFFIEGVVISAEYRRSGASRSNDPRDAMYLRTMWLHDLLPGLDRASQYGYDRLGWPSSYMLNHDYGAWLLRYLAEEYGPEKIAEIDRLNAESPLTTLSMGFLTDFGGVLHKALGVSPKEFFAGFQKWLGERFKPQLERVEAEGIVEGKRLGKLAYWNNDPAWSPDGHWIAYYHYDRLRQPGLRLIRPDGRGDHQITSFEPGLEFFRPQFWAPAPAWSPDGTELVYSKLKRYKRYYIYGDLYLYNLATGKERKLNHKARAYHPVFFPDGSRILFAKQRWGEQSPVLAIFDLESGKETILQEFPDDFLIDSFAVSPDGSQIALSAWRWGGYQDIYLMPSAGGELTPITQDRAGDFDPAWSPDGHFLLFSSDRDGINNLYAYEPATGKFYKITNVTTGAFAPDVSADGKRIIYIGYTNEGYDLRLLDFDPTSWKEVELAKEELPKWPGWPELDSPVHPYDPLPSLRPKFWLPIITPEGAGLVTSGVDYLFHHDYTLVAGYDWQNRQPFYLFNYTTNQFWPEFSLELEQNSAGSRQRLQLTLPLIDKLASSLELSLGYESRDFGRKEGLLEIAGEFNHHGGLDLNRKEEGLSVELRWGRFAGADVEGTHWKLIVEHQEWRQPPREDGSRYGYRMIYGLSDLPEGFAIGGHEGQFRLRGFDPGVLKGPEALVVNLEYRFPIANIERGLGLWPLFLNRIEGSLFTDFGAAGKDLGFEDFKFGFGGELRPQLILAYGLPLELRLGVAWGLGEKGPKFYLGFGTAFLI